MFKPPETKLSPTREQRKPTAPATASGSDDVARVAPSHIGSRPDVLAAQLRQAVADRASPSARYGAGAVLQRYTPPADQDAARARFEEAAADHRNQSRILRRWIAEGRKSKDRRLRNACNWIAAGRSRVYAVSTTGDSGERVAHHGEHAATTVALFPRVDDAQEGGHIDSPETAAYNWRDLDDQTHVKFSRAASNGWNTSTALPSGIAIAWVPTSSRQDRNKTLGPVTKDDVFETLKHEVQHAADRSQDTIDILKLQNNQQIAMFAAFGELLDAARAGESLDKISLAMFDRPLRHALRRVRNSNRSKQASDRQTLTTITNAVQAMRTGQAELGALINLEKYKTEYRAYSYQGSYKKLDNRVLIGAQRLHDVDFAGNWTERQFAVFSQIYFGYAHTMNGWDQNRRVAGAGGLTFQQAVLAYRDPDDDGVNKWDSTNIDDFYQRLIAVPARTSDADPSLPPLLAAVDALSRTEAAWVRNRARRPRQLTTIINQRLAGKARKQVMKRLDSRSHK